MPSTNLSGGATSSDYRYWRSRYRPTDGNNEPRDKKDVFYDAVCNRLGEELGQRLDRLIWPMVPKPFKRLTGVTLGRVLPWYLAFDGARKAVKGAQATGMAARLASELGLGQILVTVDGSRSNLMAWAICPPCCQQPGRSVACGARNIQFLARLR